MAKIFTRIFTFRPHDRLLLLETFISLGICLIAVRTVRFKSIVKFLSHADKRVKYAEMCYHCLIAKEIHVAVETVNRHTPWHNSCLVKALATKRMLARRKIRCCLSLGLAKDASGKLVAHAWVTACGLPLTGAGGSQSFVVMSTF